MTTFDVEALYVALDRARRARRLKWLWVAGEAGVTPSLLSKIAHGGAPSVTNLARLVLWLGDTDIAAYITDAEEGS